MLKREAIMARNSFRSLADIWRFKAESSQNRPGMSSYAAKESQFYCKLEKQICDACAVVVNVSSVLAATAVPKISLEDPIVDIEWVVDWEATKNTCPATSGAMNVSVRYFTVHSIIEAYR